jgi:hypothetical protein
MLFKRKVDNCSLNNKEKSQMLRVEKVLMKFCHVPFVKLFTS